MTNPLGLVTVDTGHPLTLGDIRRFVALMEAQGAADSAAVMAVTVARKNRLRPDDGFPAGLAELTVLGGYPRSGRGPVPDRPELGTRPRPGPAGPQ
jgi:hypothetical protein